jgi:hypothetical protein
MRQRSRIFKTVMALTLGAMYSGSALAQPQQPPDNQALQEVIDQIHALEEAVARLDTQRAQLEREIALIQAKQQAAAEGLAIDEASVAAAGQQRAPAGVNRPAPLAIRLGSAEFTPGGFLDLTAVFRSTNVGSGTATAFGSIPFANSPQGRLTESRFSAQASRLALKIASEYGRSLVTGYVEMDFLGTQPANAFITSNSNTLRLRLYWVNVRLGSWEVLGGQSWSLLTPNRAGVSPMPADIYIGSIADPNYLMGLTWTRAPQFRVTRQWSPRWRTAVSFENPQQYIGGAVTLPSPFYSSQLDSGGGLSTPSLHPDIIVKTAFDGRLGERSVHLEAAGLLRGFRVVSPDNTRTTRSGGGGSINANLELVRNLRLFATTFYSSGGGRYILGLGPDLIIRPDGTPSMVRSISGTAGLEHQVTPGWMLFGYYGVAYLDRNFSIDDKSVTGYGYAGSSLASNRAIRELTQGFVRTLWRKPELGALQVIGQYSYVQRSPWWVPVDTPPGAHSHMFFADLRYTLP